MQLPKGMNVDEHMGIQKGRMLEKKEGIQQRVKNGRFDLFGNFRMLDDGGFIQNFTDISEQKKHEEVVEKQKERFQEYLEI